MGAVSSADRVYVDTSLVPEDDVDCLSEGVEVMGVCDDERYIYMIQAIISIIVNNIFFFIFLRPLLEFFIVGKIAKALAFTVDEFCRKQYSKSISYMLVDVKEGKAAKWQRLFLIM